MKENVFNSKGEVVEQIELNENIFDGKISMSLLHQVVNSYLANAKSLRLASTKTRADVQGSGAKPWRQKGTGRARVGEKRNPLWRKGGVVFGPKPRKIRKKIPKKMKIAALKSALNAKYKDKELLILDKVDISSSKTRQFQDVVKNLKLLKKALFVDREFSRDCRLSSRNLKDIILARAPDLNAHSALNCKNIIITKDALKALEERILEIKNSDKPNKN